MKEFAGNRVLMLLENQPYPQDGRVRRESFALAEAGYQVTVICPRNEKQPGHETINGVRVIRYPSPPTGNGLVGYLAEYGYSTAASFVLSLWVAMRGGFDIVHSHNPPDTMFVIGAFFKLFGKRYVFDHHDLSPEMYNARFGDKGNRFVFRGLELLERLSCKVADRVIATNESYREVEMRRDKVNPERITIVRNGPELGRIKQVAPDEGLRKKASTIIGYVGVMGYQDGVDYLLRALHHLVHDLKRTDFYMVLVGTGDAWHDLRALTTRLGLDDHVWFTGTISDEELRRYLSTADICVDPDPSNPFNDRSTMIKITEFMALEKPIVAFDLPENRFTAQQAALFVQPNDERAFADALAELMDDPDRRARMGAYGRKRIEESLAWTHCAPKLLEVYASLQPQRKAAVVSSS
ncbi:MAG TPA: glycosyltransferase family 4 protein [Nitrolancea sp.]|nr:glycosyltransferase family 4 protein [Nitrolancea sp.]